MSRPTNAEFAAIPRLWGLLDAVIEDAAAVDHDEYYPYAPVYHRPRPKDGELPAFNVADPRDCAVCAAGIVMARRLDAPMGEDCEPGDWDWNTRTRLEAIDYLRRGAVHEAGRCIYGYEDPGVRLVDGKLARATLPQPRDVQFNGWPAFGLWLDYARELRDVLKGIDL